MIVCGFGSSFFHGDQPSHAWRSFTWANTTAGGAAMALDRLTEKVLGWRLMETHKPRKQPQPVWFNPF